MIESGNWKIERDEIQWVIYRRGEGGPWKAVAFVYNAEFMAHVLTEPSRKIPLKTVIDLLTQWEKEVGAIKS